MSTTTVLKQEKKSNKNESKACYLYFLSKIMIKPSHKLLAKQIINPLKIYKTGLIQNNPDQKMLMTR